MFEDVIYKDGHKCVHNGTGDYNLVCPKLGKIDGFIPYMHARLLDGKTCRCGDKLKMKEDA